MLVLRNFGLPNHNTSSTLSNLRRKPIPIRIFMSWPTEWVLTNSNHPRYNQNINSLCFPKQRKEPQGTNILNWAMDSYRLLGFVGILRDALNIFSRNGKLMASITILTLLLHSILFMSNIVSTKLLITDMVKESFLLYFTSPNNSLESAKLLVGIKEDVRILVGLECTFILAYSIVLFFSLTATIFASSITYCRKDFTVKDFLSRIVRSWIRPFVTWFYVTLLGTGYTFLVLAIWIPLLVIVNGPIFVSYATSIVLGILACVLYTYLSVVWILSIVISVIEESCYGIEALGKAGRLVKGMELHGFALNLLFTLLSFAVYPGFKLIGSNQSVAIRIIIGLVVVNLMCLLTMFRMVAYTVFYYQCKKTHGDEIELQGTIEYSKLSTTPLDIEDIP